MKSQLPIRRNAFDVQGFVAFLAQNGCEIGKPSNQYEVVRYRAYWQGGKRPITHLVYAKETGILTWMHGSQGHYRAFLAGQPITGNRPPFQSELDKPHAERRADASPKSPKPKSASIRAKLLARDGTCCWFCGEAMGVDCTIEHLIAKAKGGSNSLDNYALAHQKCNADAADKPLAEKIAMRLRLHGQVSA